MILFIAFNTQINYYTIDLDCKRLFSWTTIGASKTWIYKGYDRRVHDLEAETK